MFHFSLQTALDVREQQEKVKMKELAETLSAEQKIRVRIDDIQQNLIESERRLDQQKSEEKFNINILKYHFGFKTRMDLVLTGLDLSLKEAQIETNKKRHLLVEASRTKKTLEILKEKEKKRILAKIARQEQIEMDEIAGNFFNSTRKSVEN